MNIGLTWSGKPQAFNIDEAWVHPAQESRLRCETMVILRAVRNGTSDTNPKRQRGNELEPSLTLRVSVTSGREQYNLI